MPDQLPKPPAFIAGAKALSANALNLLRQAIPRLLIGGAGIDVSPYDDRFVISLTDAQGGPASPFALLSVIEEKHHYLVCESGDATPYEEGGEWKNVIFVAKPWGLRYGAIWPVEGPTGGTIQYEYSTGIVGQRTATDAGITEVQVITPAYQAVEEILAVRLPSARVLRSYVQEIEPPDSTSRYSSRLVWMDVNVGGRCWAVVEDVDS